MNNICPYCNKHIGYLSKDHIFSAFLGGRKKIDSCKSCNDIFGHSFEAQAAKMLQGMQVSMSSWGLPLNNSEQIWKGSHEFNGIKYNLHADGSNVSLSLAHPIVQKDNDGKTISVSYNTQEEALKAAKNNKNKGKLGQLKKYSIKLPFTGARFTFNIDRNLMRTAMKMCTAICSLDSRISTVETEYARAALSTTSNDSLIKYIHIVFNNYKVLDDLRPALSHVIYVERSRGIIYGVVQFFGVIQLYCLIGRSLPDNSDMAILGILDPVEDVESFNHELNPLYLPIPNFDIKNSIDKNMNKLLRKFEKSAVERGATITPKLSGKGELTIY